MLKNTREKKIANDFYFRRIENRCRRFTEHQGDNQSHQTVGSLAFGFLVSLVEISKTMENDGKHKDIAKAEHQDILQIYISDIWIQIWGCRRN